MGAFSRSQLGEGGAENNRFASKAPNALTFFLSDGFIEKVRNLVRPPLNQDVAEASHGALICFSSPLPASVAGGAGTRPDHSIMRYWCLERRLRLTLLRQAE